MELHTYWGGWLLSYTVWPWQFKSNPVSMWDKSHFFFKLMGKISIFLILTTLNYFWEVFFAYVHSYIVHWNSYDMHMYICYQRRYRSICNCVDYCIVIPSGSGCWLKLSLSFTVSSCLFKTIVPVFWASHHFRWCLQPRLSSPRLPGNLGRYTMGVASTNPPPPPSHLYEPWWLLVQVLVCFIWSLVQWSCTILPLTSRPRWWQRRSWWVCVMRCYVVPCLF